jgi:hypothetical protein
MDWPRVKHILLGLQPSHYFYIVAKSTKSVKQLLKPKLMALRFKTSDWRDSAADEFAYGARPVVSEPVVLKRIGELNNEDEKVTGGEESATLPIKGNDAEKNGVLARWHAAAKAARGANQLNS